MKILKIAINTPVRQYFDYLLPDTIDQVLQLGQRVLVPYGPRKMIGVLIAEDNQSKIAPAKLKPIIKVLENEPLLGQQDLALLKWASQYYHHPLGEVILGTLPSGLREVKTKLSKQEPCYRLSQQGQQLDYEQHKRAKKQVALIQYLRTQSAPCPYSDLREQGFNLTVVRAVVQHGWVVECDANPFDTMIAVSQPTYDLNAEQHHAVAQVCQQQGFSGFLLEGVTGSGKTEVYLQIIEHVITQGKQALVLVPEINLTPQTVARFKERFDVPIAVFHSALSQTERMESWFRSKKGEVAIIIGTRSAIFTPLKNPGIIILDEEHDISFKQQAGFRYCARDVAMVRGQQLAIPVLLGSATPALETIYNQQRGRYKKLSLPQRAGAVAMPSLKLIDLRNQHLEEGLSPELMRVMRAHLERGKQVLLFLNRRGFAPALLCHSCGWVAKCTRCDVSLVCHHSPRRLICHHCGTHKQMIQQCPDCQQGGLIPVGVGTERLEQALQQHFADWPVIRVDSDTTRRKGSLERLLNDIDKGDASILLGTQMLAKGHHFPNVSLVAVIDADSGLYSADFRATERMLQLLLQVSGRAGRVAEQGEVLIQSHVPDHPILQGLIHSNYAAVADILLQERRLTCLPPYFHLALFRAESLDVNQATQFLQQLAEIMRGQVSSESISILGPIPAPLERVKNRYRMQLLVQASDRKKLHQHLGLLLENIRQLKPIRHLRWSIDVDPKDMN